MAMIHCGTKRGSIPEDLIAVMANFPMHDVASFSEEHKNTTGLKALGLCFIPGPLDWSKPLFVKVLCKLALPAGIHLSTVIFRV